jgi:hypothetical protein
MTAQPGCARQILVGNAAHFKRKAFGRQAHLDTATENGSGTLPKPAGEDACAT